VISRLILHAALLKLELMQTETAPSENLKQADVKPVVVLLLIVCLIAAALYFLPTEEKQTQTLTNFSENFEGTSISSLNSQGWYVWYKPRMSEITGYSTSYPEETLTVENGVLKAEIGAGGLVYPADWSNFTFHISFKRATVTWVGVAFRCDNTWISGTKDNVDSGSWCNNGYLLQLGFEDSTNRIWKIVNGEMTNIASKDFTITKETWHSVSLQLQNSSISVYIDNQQLFDIQDSDITSGGIALINHSGPVWFDNLEIEF